MPFIPSAFGNILSGFGDNLEKNRLEQYQREQDALAYALKSRQLDLTEQQNEMQGQNNMLQRQYQQQNYLATQRERQGDDARAWANQAPTGTQLPTGQLGSDIRRLFPSQFEETGLPQLASTAISGVVRAGAPIESAAEPDSEINIPELMSGFTQQNPSTPGGAVWGGSSLTQNREGNLGAREAQLELSRAMQEARLDQGAERNAMAQQRLQLAQANYQRALSAVQYLPTSEGYMAMPKYAGGGQPTPIAAGQPVSVGGRSISIPGLAGGGSVPERPPQMPSVAQPQANPAVPPQANPVRPPAEGQLPPAPGGQQDPDVDPVGMEVIRTLRPPNAGLTADAAKISPLAALLAEQKRLAPLVNTGKGGLESVVGAGQNYKKLLWDKDDPNVIDTQLYQDKYLATLARLSGEVGVLTEQDAQRARSWLIDLNDSETEANRKIVQFANFLNQKIEHLNRFGLVPPGQRRAVQQEPQGWW